MNAHSYYDNLIETAYLIQSTANAMELLKTLEEANQNIGIELNF